MEAALAVPAERLTWNYTEAKIRSGRRQFSESRYLRDGDT